MKHTPEIKRWGISYAYEEEYELSNGEWIKYSDYIDEKARDGAVKMEMEYTINSLVEANKVMREALVKGEKYFAESDCIRGMYANDVKRTISTALTTASKLTPQENILSEKFVDVLLDGMVEDRDRSCKNCGIKDCILVDLTETIQLVKCKKWTATKLTEHTTGGKS